MGTFFKEQLHLKEPFQTFKSLTPLQHTTRTDRMKFLLPILLISLAALCHIHPAAAQEIAQEETQQEAQEAAQVEEEVEQGVETDDEPLTVDELQEIVETIDNIVTEDELIDVPESVGNESGMTTRGATIMLRWTYRQRVYLRKSYVFFKKADRNHTGKLTWAEFWRAYYWRNRRAGNPHWKIMKYKWYTKKTFYKLAGRDRLLSWAEVVRHV